jgi:hypothetical protein
VNALRKAIATAALVATVTLGMAMATSTSASAAPDVPTTACIGSPPVFALALPNNAYLDRSDVTGWVDFSPNTALKLCQVRIAAGSSIVTLYVKNSSGFSLCLALDANASRYYVHSPTGCGSSTLKYLQWRFIYLGTSGGFKEYALQNQYDGKCLKESNGVGVPGACNLGLNSAIALVLIATS